MPGLHQGVTRTAVITGTATHVTNNVSRRRSLRSRRTRTPRRRMRRHRPARPGARRRPDRADQGAGGAARSVALTDEEFAAPKAKLLG